MAQLERRKKLSECSPNSPKSQNSPTFDQLLRVEETYWSSNASPSGRACHDHEVCPTDSKKSVLSKVKETAKKLKYSLSGKRRHGFGLELHDDHEHEQEHDNHHHHHVHSHDHHLEYHQADHVTPVAWGATFEDDYDHEQDGDPEYLGAPMYESEAAPECLKETARQHPRADPVVAENHRAPNMAKHEEGNTSMIANTTHAVAEKLAPACAAVSDAAHNINADTIKNTTRSVADKLAPAYTAVSDATHNINTGMITNTTHSVANTLTNTTHTVADKLTNTTHTVADKLAPACAAVSDATHQIASKIAGIAVTSPEQERSRYSAVPQQDAKAVLMSEDAGNLKQCSGSSPQTYDKGVSVKEYFLNKLEPGEDERALSQAITEAISPRKSTGETGVVDKMKEAVTSFFRQDEGSNSTPKTADLASSPAPHPVSAEIVTIAGLNSVDSIPGEKTARPSSAALETSNSPGVVQLKSVVTSVHADKTASPSAASGISSIAMNSQQPQLNRIASVHVRSTKVFTDSNTNPPLIPVSNNAHEVYEEESHGRILQTN